MSKKLLVALVMATLSIGNVWASELSSAQSLASAWVITTAADYRLGDTITRKEMMKIVMNLSGKNVPDTCNGTFGDVSNDWGCKYIESALANGFIAKNASFRPNDTITKAESMKLALKARGIGKSQNTSDWQGDYMMTALENGIISTKYTDHNTQAKRGWIFDISATPVGVMKKDSDVMMDKWGDIMVKETTWSYSNYDNSLVGATNTTVLFFHAEWCPSCIAADASISKANIASTDITLLKVDFDNSVDLRQKYGVTTQHTFVHVDANGKLIKKWSWSNSLADLESKIEVLVP